MICIRSNPHTSRGKYRGGSSGVDSDGILRIGTNLLDVPAEVVGLVFSNRWAIEIFFRFFKHILGCRHLLSHNQNGIEIQTYCHHRVPADCSLDGQETHAPHIRNDLLLFLRDGGRG